MATMLNPNAIPDGSITKEKIDAAVLTTKQDKLTAGNGISIKDNKIGVTAITESESQPSTHLWVNPSEDAETGLTYNRSQIDALVGAKQDTLQLTVKDNGNIVLSNLQGQSKEFMPATPSGDPMHYAYVAAGAEYNENTGFWKIGTLDDLTNDELKRLYSIRVSFVGINGFNGFYAFMKSRTIFPLRMYGEGLSFTNLGVAFYYSDFVEIPPSLDNRRIKLTGQSTLNFAHCRNLKYIRMPLIFTNVRNNTTDFMECRALEEVLCITDSNLYFNDCPKLSIESVLYIINNEMATSSITITLHTDAYVRAMANADIVAALEAHPNVSLASA